MKILFLNHTDRVSVRVNQEIRSLLGRGFDIKVIAIERGTKVVEEISSVQRESVRWVSKKGLAQFLSLPWAYVKIFLKLFCEKFDIVHCTNLKFLLPCVLAAKLRGRKVIYDAYEFPSVTIPTHLPVRHLRSPFSWMIRSFEDLLVIFVDAVLTVDSTDRLLFHRYYRLNKNVEVLFNVPTIRSFQSAEKIEVLRSKYNGYRLIIHIGEISKIKGAKRALESLRLVKNRIKNVRLIFIGECRDDSQMEIHQFVSEKGLEDDVEFIDWLPYEEMMSYLEVSKIGLSLLQATDPKSTFVSGGTSRKIFTYMHCGLPVIAPTSEVGRVVIEEGCGIAVDPQDSEQIARAIICLIEHPSKATEMGNRGRKSIHEKYNWELEEEKLLGLYGRVLNENRGGGANTSRNLWQALPSWKVRRFMSWGGEDHPSRRKIRALIQDASSYLEVGCGPGWNYGSIKKQYPNLSYTGIDITPKFIQTAKKRYPEGNFLVGDVHDLVELFGENSYDVVSARHLLEHLEDFRQPLKQMFSVARRKVFITFYIPPQPMDRSMEKVDLHCERKFHTYMYNYDLIMEFVEKVLKPADFNYYTGLGGNEPGKMIFGIVIKRNKAAQFQNALLEIIKSPY